MGVKERSSCSASSWAGEETTVSRRTVVAMVEASRGAWRRVFFASISSDWIFSRANLSKVDETQSSSRVCVGPPRVAWSHYRSPHLRVRVSSRSNLVSCLGVNPSHPRARRSHIPASITTDRQGAATIHSTAWPLPLPFALLLAFGDNAQHGPNSALPARQAWPPHNKIHLRGAFFVFAVLYDSLYTAKQPNIRTEPHTGKAKPTPI